MAIGAVAREIMETRKQQQGYRTAVYELKQEIIEVEKNKKLKLEIRDRRRGESNRKY